MRPVVEKGVTIDVCDDCHGVWLEPGELNSLARNTEFLPGDVDVSYRDDVNCPRCDQNKFADVSTCYGTLSRCVHCGGIFVGGETLDALSNASSCESSTKAIADACSLPTEIAGLMTDVLRLFGSH